MSNIISNKLKQLISSIENEENSIIVFKGIPVTDYIENSVDLDIVANNKMGFLISNMNSRKVYSYEEFLLLKDFLLSQYKSVYVVDNNLYINMYPIYLNCSDETISGLLTHFVQNDNDDDLSDDDYIGDISEILNLFVGVKKYNNYYFGTYNDESIKSHDKIIRLPLFENKNTSIELAECDGSDEIFNITNENDYLELLKFLFEEPSEIKICTDSYFDDMTKLNVRLQLITSYWSDYTDIYIVKRKEIEASFEHSDEVKAVLKKYWNYDSFRTLKMYDFHKLDSGVKEVIDISQERIIGDLITQVEKCVDGDNQASDIFVTAPTGAGKSVMFQVPAIYLAEKYNLLTIVISPLIGLMNDQVKNLETKKYTAAKTINSDISPILKQEIMQKVADSEYHILYISPETLLSRSDVEQLIGDRTIGMIVIDEAHIVTTWGKQFRPDYWYLGDHIRKIRKNQISKKGQSFVIATFTATAIYKGLEDMYSETINSLNMVSPITYLGYVKRDDILIDIEHQQRNGTERYEYEAVKFEDIEKLIFRAELTNKKTLIYFPTVALINRCFETLRAKSLSAPVAIYHGSLDKDEKQEYYEKFLNGEKRVMLATKAFGMGIDINDIEIVAHFAPTGNVCDYVQEIGRAARRSDLIGEAYYNYNSRDFKHINRLHGLSMIKEYQLVEVIRKIVDLYETNLKSVGKNNFTRKRNAMLIDAENFSHIFGMSENEENDNINKVKTALLIIQKDFERRGFSPVNIRPIPLFAMGYFKVSSSVQSKINHLYPNSISAISQEKEIYQVNLENIWKKSYSNYSFPKFKFLLYSNSEELNFLEKFPMTPVLCVDVLFAVDHESEFNKIWKPIKGYINNLTITSEYINVDDLINHLVENQYLSKYKARPVCEVLIAAINMYKNDFYKKTTPLVATNYTNAGVTSYRFNPAIREFFTWVEKKYQHIRDTVEDDTLYLVNDYGNSTKEMNMVLGLLEVFGVLSFKMIGGANSQLYIYINQIQSMRNIIAKPSLYKNRLLETVNSRHLISVKMLTYIYESEFTNAEIWNLIEDYFLGVIPEHVKLECRKENPELVFDIN